MQIDFLWPALLSAFFLHSVFGAVLAYRASRYSQTHTKLLSDDAIPLERGRRILRWSSYWHKTRIIFWLALLSLAWVGSNVWPI